jgi:PAS domain-containing protein
MAAAPRGVSHHLAHHRPLPRPCRTPSSLCLKSLSPNELGLALFATSNVLVFAILVWFAARKLNAEFEQRNQAESDLRELNVELEQRVAERTKDLEQQAGVLSEQAALLDLAQDAIIVRDMHGAILFWSRGAQAMYGWTSREACGRNMS